MRALEVLLSALEKRLKITKGIDQWGERLKDIQTAIVALPSSDPDKQFLDDIRAQFRPIKDAWRNYAVHGKAHYNEPQARKIYQVVGSMFSDASAKLKE
jgi:hypothetical protein